MPGGARRRGGARPPTQKKGRKPMDGISSEVQAERRESKRQILRLNKVFSAEMTIDGIPKHSYLYVLDVTEQGMKITTHFELPTVPIPVKFHFEQPLEVTILK